MFQNIVNKPLIKGAEYEDTLIELEDRTVTVRVFNNFNDEKKHKLIVFFHGGGWISGSILSYTHVCNTLSLKTDCIVAAVEYRLAPEKPFPAGFDDCYGVTKTIYDNLDQIGLTSEDVVLMGDSAGGNLTAAVSKKALDTKDFKVKKQILLYPALQSDYSITTKYNSVIENGYDYLITRKQLVDFMDHYIVKNEDYNNPYVAPLYSKRMMGLPETCVVVCSHDPLRDEGIEYYKKLKRNFIKATLTEFNSPHGYMTDILEKTNTNKTYKLVKEFIES